MCEVVGMELRRNKGKTCREKRGCTMRKRICEGKGGEEGKAYW